MYCSELCEKTLEAEKTLFLSMQIDVELCSKKPFPLFASNAHTKGPAVINDCTKLPGYPSGMGAPRLANAPRWRFDEMGCFIN